MDILGLLVVPNWIIYAIILFLVYKFYTLNHGLFVKLGIPGPKPYPVVGSMHLMYKYGFREMDKILLEKYGKIVGVCLGIGPRLIIADVDLLKRILIKDFSYFQDRQLMFLRGILKRSVFDARGEKWKDARHLLTPAFTTGKLKEMIPLMNICGDRLMAIIEEKYQNNLSFEVKELCGAYALDIIASTSFGLELDCQNNPDDPFVHHAKQLNEFDLFSPWMFLLIFFPLCAPIFDILGFRMLAGDSIDFFTKMLRTTIKQRRQGIGTRVDTLQMMLDAERHLAEADEETKEDLKITGDRTSQRKPIEVCEDDIVAQSIMFLTAGYETTASTLAFLIYELAVNQEVQDKVYAEIEDVIGNQEPKHEDLYRLSYMEMCINETMRLFPLAAAVDRYANEDYEYNGFKIPKRTVVAIPILYLLHDPDVWPEPERFDPERFSPEAKASRDSMNFIPFGLGPRNCIGMRFALLEIKLTLIKLLRRFKIVPCEETQIPLRFIKSVIIKTEKGIWVKVEPRL